MATGLLHVLNAGQADAAFATVKANGNTTVRRNCCVDADVGMKYDDSDVLTLAYFRDNSLFPKNRKRECGQAGQTKRPLCALCASCPHKGLIDGYV